MATKKYIDVSTHQNTIDWEKVKAAGVDGVMIRAGYGQNNIDKQFVRNVTECNRLGIPCGVYWFSYARSVELAKKEAEYCLAAIRPYKIELPVCYDFEYDSVANAKKQGINVTKELASSFVHAFCKTIEEAGYYVMNYANPDYLNNYFDSTVSRYDLWLAWYKTKPDLNSRPHKCGIWQYTSSGKVNGISGNVDINVSYNDYKTIIARVGLNNPREWYDDAKDWCVARGITDGANPDATVTNAEVWSMIYKALK